jgi:hypothetical protein
MNAGIAKNPAISEFLQVINISSAAFLFGWHKALSWPLSFLCYIAGGTL